MRKNFINYLGACALLIAVLLVGCDKNEPIVEEDLNGFDVRPDFKTATAAEIEAYMATPEMTETSEEDKARERLDDLAAPNGVVEDGYTFESDNLLKRSGSTKRSGTVQLGIDPLDFTPGPSGPTWVVQQYSFFGWQTIYLGDDDNVLFNLPYAWYPTVCNSKYYSYRVRAYEVTGCNEYEVVLSKIGCSGVIDRDFYSVEDDEWMYFVSHTETYASCGTDRTGVRPNNCLAGANMCAFTE